MIEIRELRDSDIDALAEVHVRTWQSAYAGIVPAEVLAALDPVAWAARRRTRTPPPGARTLVADDDGAVIGFATFGPGRLKNHSGVDDQTGELYAIYVDPTRQRDGAGRLLLTAARKQLTEAGFPVMWLWVFEENHPARRFYERMGLAPDGEQQFYTPPGSTVELPEIRYAVRL